MIKKTTLEGSAEGGESDWNLKNFEKGEEHAKLKKS